STTGRSGERSRRPLRATRSDQNQTASAATASSSGLVLPQATRVGPDAGMRTGCDPEETSSCTPPRYTHDHPNFEEQQGARGDPLWGEAWGVGRGAKAATQFLAQRNRGWPLSTPHPAGALLRDRQAAA